MPCPNAYLGEDFAFLFADPPTGVGLGMLLAIAGRNRGLILCGLMLDATAAGMATTPMADRCGHRHTGKDGSDRHALLPASGVLSHMWSRFRTLFELRDSYVCSWCELHDNDLILVPSRESGRPARHVHYPNDATIVGRVTALSMRIAEAA
jgi:hypothetical protein